jgi:hypothetical protein
MFKAICQFKDAVAKNIKSLYKIFKYFKEWSHIKPI